MDEGADALRRVKPTSGRRCLHWVIRIVLGHELKLRQHPKDGSAGSVGLATA